MLTSNVPTSRELIALTKCVFYIHGAFAVYRLEGSDVTISRDGLFLPEPFRRFDVEELWVEMPNTGNLVCLRGQMRGHIYWARAAYASA
jgi:hypothetical protein